MTTCSASHVTTAATQADQYWHLHRSDCRNTLISVHTNSRALAICDVSTGLLTLRLLKAGDFVELILLCLTPVVEMACVNLFCSNFSYGMTSVDLKQNYVYGHSYYGNSCFRLSYMESSLCVISIEFSIRNCPHTVYSLSGVTTSRRYMFRPTY